MPAVAFDTIKLARKLESLGMPSKQAQDMSASLSETFTEWLSVGNVATKEDVQEVKMALREDVRNLEVKLEAKISETKAEIMKWMFGQTVFLLAALYGLIHSTGKL